jgi:hypothetical protein
MRSYCTVDKPGYFDKCVWPEYLKYKERCEAKYSTISSSFSSISSSSGAAAEIQFVDGAQPVETVFQSVLNDIEQFLQQQNNNNNNINKSN